MIALPQRVVALLRGPEDLEPVVDRAAHVAGELGARLDIVALRPPPSLTAHLVAAPVAAVAPPFEECHVVLRDAVERTSPLPVRHWQVGCGSRRAVAAGLRLGEADLVVVRRCPRSVRRAADAAGARVWSLDAGRSAPLAPA